MDNVRKIYDSVINDVISQVENIFSTEGIDEVVLQELKTIWKTKVLSSKAVEISSVSSLNLQVSLHNNNIVSTEDIFIPIQLNLPTRLLTVNVPPKAVNNSQLNIILPDSVIAASANLPDNLASVYFQEYIKKLCQTREFTNASDKQFL